MQTPRSYFTRCFLASVVIQCMAHSPAWPQIKNPAHLVEGHCSRGDAFTVTLENGPASANEKSIKLRRQGQEFDVENVTYSIAAAVGTLTGEVPKDLPFGDYEVTVYLDGRRFPASPNLSIGPLGASGVHLSDFVPASTYETEVAYLLNPVTRQGTPIRVVGLLLHGTGFQFQHPEDNTIWINHIHTSVKWDTCSTAQPLRNKNAPAEAGIHGEVLSPEQIKLCRVPVPEDRQLLIAVGYGDTSSEARPFRVFSLSELQVALISTLIAIVLALLPLGLLSFVKHSYSVAGEPYRLRMLFLDPETDTYSLSKLQFYLWTVASLFAYAYLFIARVKVQYLAWPDVPTTLPGIISVAAATAIGSQVITSVKGSKGSGEEKPSFADFITSGGVVAADRLQMLLWTLFGVGAFFVAVLQEGPGTISELPAVPERLLYLMGISSAGYLGGKLARKPGPVINEISVDPPESDAAITKAATPTRTGLADLVQITLNAQAQLNSFAPVTNAHARAVIEAFSSAIRTGQSPQTPSEINQMIVDLVKLRQQAEQEAAATAADFASTPPTATQSEAETAQAAAAALQDFSGGVTQAISIAATEVMDTINTAAFIRRTIELRGTNLSTECLLEIDHTDLPFRFLLNEDGQNAPEIVVREDSTPTFASVLRLSIDPAKLATPDLAQFEKWFGSDGTHTFTLTNPDGQKAELSFALGPDTPQKGPAS